MSNPSVNDPSGKKHKFSEILTWKYYMNSRVTCMDIFLSVHVLTIFHSSLIAKDSFGLLGDHSPHFTRLSYSDFRSNIPPSGKSSPTLRARVGTLQPVGQMQPTILYRPQTKNSFAFLSGWKENSNKDYYFMTYNHYTRFKFQCP